MDWEVVADHHHQNGRRLRCRQAETADELLALERKNLAEKVVMAFQNRPNGHRLHLVQVVRAVLDE